MISNFKNFGLHQNKSTAIEYPKGNFNENFHRGFISGFFDGDGSIGIRKRDKRIRISFTSDSLKILNEIPQIIYKYTKIGPKKTIR